MISRLRLDCTADRLAPEMELMLCCARLELDDPHADRIRNLSAGPLNWDRFLTAAMAHGCAPLVFRHVCALGLELVPPRIVDRLRLAFAQSTKQSLALLKAVWEVLGLLDRHGISAMPYKGPVLALQLYEHPGLRPCQDIDIVVRSEDTRQALELLENRGYRHLHDHAGLARELQYGWERPLLSAEGTLIDVHWRLFPRFCSIHLDPEELWRSCRRERIQGREISVLPAETLLPLLCVHGARHLWRRIEWLTDISLLARKVIRWNDVVGLADRMAASRMLHLGLQLAHELLEMPLPDVVRENVRGDAEVKRLVRAVRANLQPGAVYDAGFLQTQWFWFVARERMSDRLRCLIHGLQHPSQLDRSFVSLPSGLEFLYPGVKVIRIGHRIASEAVRGVAH